MRKAGGMGLDVNPAGKKSGGFAPALGQEWRKMAGDWLLLVGRCTLGAGSGELGAALMERFFAALAVQEIPPAAIFFYNEGVTLCCSDSPVATSLCTLEQLGVEIYACGASLEHYHGLRDLCTGKMAALDTMVARIASAMRVVTL